MNDHSSSDRPIVGWQLMMEGKRWPSLRGNWSKPPKRAPSKIEQLCIFAREGFHARDTEFLTHFPNLRIVRISLDAPIDFSGLYRLTKLEDLWLQTTWFSTKKLPILDLSRLPQLRRLSTPYFAKLQGLASLSKLTHLRLHHVYGLKEMDFRPHPRLEVLSLGPANGVAKIHLDEVRCLRSLELACMRDLQTITGTDFYDTVTDLDIRASTKIPASFLSRFRRLKDVTIGMKSTIRRDSFPLCSPSIMPGPV